MPLGNQQQVWPMTAPAWGRQPHRFDASHDLHLDGEVLHVVVDLLQIVVHHLQVVVERQKLGHRCCYLVDRCAHLLVHHQQLFVLRVGGHGDDERVELGGKSQCGRDLNSTSSGGAAW
jgi:hypothetical protein